MKKHFLTTLFFVLGWFILLNAQESPKLLRKDYSIKSPICNGSTDDYFVTYQNIDKKPLDIVIAINDLDGKWMCREKTNIAPNDTMSFFLCKSKGNLKIDFRYAGASVGLEDCGKLNEEYYKQHPEKKIEEPTQKLTTISAKVLFGDKEKKPLANQKVSLKDGKGKTMQSTTTDKYGDFTFSDIQSKANLEFYLEKNPNLTASDKVFIAETNGKIINEMKRDPISGGFVYKLLPADVKKMTLLDEAEDPFLAIKDFSKSANKNITVADNIYYAPGSKELVAETKVKLEKVISVLRDNPTLKIEVISHTDSKGDDQSNLKLSEERAKIVAGYLVAKGINGDRIASKGLGETQLLNRCQNGIDCSEKEHQLNRRTEFRFIKSE
ncbi:MAG: OmpA family protein [Bacteroidetes bacterium]|nr:OmpA family protein [Bacteroidota bacterium]